VPAKSSAPVSVAVPERIAPAPAPQTRDDPVLRATYDSVMEVGVRRTTLADVARRAGVSRMTVYRKYDDLSRLLAALLSVELAAILASAKEQTRDSRDTRTMLAKTVASATVDLATHPVLARVLAVDPEAMLPLIVDRFGSTQLVALAQVTEMIRHGQSPNGDGSIRPGDPEMLALTLLACTQSFVFSARAISTVDPLGKRYSELEELTLRYLAVDPGAPTGDAESSSRPADDGPNDPAHR